MGFKLIDMYILKRFFNLLVFIIAAGIIIFLAVDLIENLDKFIDRNVDWKITALYYLYFIPYVIYLILPVTVLLTVLFSLGGMASANEIIALKASGVSMYRILFVLMAPGFFISLFTLGFGETLVPYYNKQRMDIFRHEVKQLPRSSAMRRGRIYLTDGPNRYVHIGHFNGETMTAFNVVVLTVDDNILTDRIDAKRMVYMNNHWVVYDAVSRQFRGDSMRVEKEPVFDYRVLKFTPEELFKIELKPEEMNYWELQEFTEKLMSTGADARRWRVDLQAKLATPFAAFIIVIFGVPIAIVKRRSGIMVGFGIALLSAFFYFGTTQSGKMLAYKGIIEPDLAVWGGHVIFALIGIIGVIGARK